MDVTELIAAAKASQVGIEEVEAPRQCVTAAERTFEKVAASREVDARPLERTYNL